MAGPLGLGPCVFQTLGLERSERNSLSSPLPAYPRAELSGSVCLSREPLFSLRVWGVTLRQVGSAQGDLASTSVWSALTADLGGTSACPFVAQRL